MAETHEKTETSEETTKESQNPVHKSIWKRPGFYLIIAAIIIVIIGIIGYEINRKYGSTPAWVWFTFIAGIVLAIIGIILMFVV